MAEILSLLCVFTALTTRCYCSINTVMVKWNQVHLVVALAAQHRGVFLHTPGSSAGVTAVPELLWSCCAEPGVQGQPQGWCRGVGCWAEPQPVSEGCGGIQGNLLGWHHQSVRDRPKEVAWSCIRGGLVWMLGEGSLPGGGGHGTNSQGQSKLVTTLRCRVWTSGDSV